ncbi:MoaD/ThiS family protein [Alteromonas ponticola]|uniref:Molybdopterin synthase sulfur carrier subunit n=1 Tax=Alteromonas ponticola TaxID=2720613 RepID=A0ABX1R7J2_9ALTE|nr:MoaD/ThiS family protein [Alteromonas ponticola]NMH61198.1 molybdopterin synthase sulfur carrier subunit [Alteromonas ponticola]
MITVKCFAQVREISQTEEMSLSFHQNMSIADVQRQLCAQGEQWQKAFSLSPLIACNHIIVSENHVLNEGDEVAFFPPVTGG